MSGTLCTLVGNSVVTAPAFVRPLTITVNGDTQVDTSQSKFGGASAYFDGTGDYLQIDQDITFGTGDFTIEFWYYADAFTGAGQNIYEGRETGAATVPTIYHINGNLYYYSGSNRITGTSALTVDTWHHIAVSRSSGSTKMFVDGTQVGSTFSDTLNYIAHKPNISGYLPGNGGWIEGWIDEFRISDTARYTTTFTPQDRLFANDENTLLLLHMDGADGSTTFTDDTNTTIEGPFEDDANTVVLLDMDGTNGGTTFSDSSGNGYNFTARGNANTDTGTKFYGTASLELDGTGDAIDIDNATVAKWNTTANRTIEFWIKCNRTANTEVFLFQGVNTGGTTDYWQIFFTSTNIVLNVPGSGNLVNTALSRDTTRWHHFAWVKQTNSNAIYWDGTSIATFTFTDATWGNTDNNVLYVGYQQGGTTGFSGYIDELRISDSARYTSNFQISRT